MSLNRRQSDVVCSHDVGVLGSEIYASDRIIYVDTGRLHRPASKWAQKWHVVFRVVDVSGFPDLNFIVLITSMRVGCENVLPIAVLIESAERTAHKFTGV